MSVGTAAMTEGGRTAWARNLAAPVRSFLSTETGGAMVMLGAVIAALLWANSPWWHSYESVWTTTLAVQVGSAGIVMDLRHWVNEGLMTLFFLVVGLEAKRQLDLGELRERRRLAIPVFAAIGGITVPVLIYLAFNAGGRRRARVGRGDVNRYCVRARSRRPRDPPDRDADSRVPADAGGRRRSRRAARDRDRLHQSCLARWRWASR